MMLASRVSRLAEDRRVDAALQDVDEVALIVVDVVLTAVLVFNISRLVCMFYEC